MAKVTAILEVIRTMNSLKRKRAISDYAIYGAVAMMRYTEAFFTQDLDILVVPRKELGPLVLLTPVFDEFAGLGYKWKGGHILVEGFPVQFMSADELEREAVANARRVKIGGLRTKVLSPEYLVALSARAGRAKDKAKIALLMTQARVDKDKLSDILNRHGLRERYEEVGRWLDI
ncbi:MAG: hypothetical protein HYX82_05615 [Chloroflexi bacterium]|nr:hypothetical protein [Chloroflexota bacterium]